MKTNYIDALSIVIPTYNRPDKLKRLLESIFKQNLSDIYEIVVVNNCSNYKIEDITHQFDLNKIRIINNPFNVRMATNMVNTFLHCKTKWMWLISDDDVICENATSIINNRISKNPEVGYLKFSTEGIGEVGLENDEKVHNLEQFIDYYANKEVVRSDNLVFVSNGVFNLEALYPFLGFGYEFSYTYIGFLIPVFYSLNEEIPVKFCDEKVIKFVNPGNGVWSFSTVGLGLSTLSHLPLSLDKSYFKKFLKITMLISYKNMFKYLLKQNKEGNQKVYNMIYHSNYKYYLNFTQKIFFHLFTILLVYPKSGNYLLKIFKK